MADRIVGEYAIKVDEAIKNLNELVNRVDALEKKGKKSAKETEDAYSKMTSNLMGQFKNLAGAIGIAFSARQVISLGKEMVTLAAQAEGVERAFKRVGSPQLLDDLRKATRGTVSDLQLMQNAVKASNFKIPLENLASLFRFAQARARETGESVDYLVDSIILGIGRKSPLILDNLGISAVELRERLKGVGVEAANVGEIAQIIGDIADEELKKMGDQADTTADKIAQLGVAYNNYLKRGGDVIIDILTRHAQQAGIISQNQAAVDEYVSKLASMSIPSISEEIKKQKQAIEDAEKAYVKFAIRFDEIASSSPEIASAEQERLGKEIRLQKELYDIVIKTFNARIDAARSGDVEFMSPDEIQRIVDANTKLDEVQKEQIKNVAYYKALIKQLEEEQNAENTTLERNTQLNQELKVAREELARLLGKETDEQKKLREQLEKIALLRAQEWQMMQSVGVPVTVALSSTIEGLNTLLKEQKQILETSPEFSQQYKDALIAVDALEKRIKNFNEGQIDPSQGYQSYAPGGDMSATGQGLLNNSQSGIDLDALSSELDEAFALWDNFFSSINELQALNNQLALEDLEQRFQNEEITRAEYEAQKKQLLREEAARAKSLAIFQAIVGTAQAVVQALNAPPPSSFIFAALAAATGAAQIGIIASQPTPQFAEGGFVDKYGLLKGRKHGQGGIKIEAEGGEFITAAKYAQPNADILRAINTGNWEKYKVENIIAPAIEEVLKGGFEGINGSYQLNSMFNDRNIIKVLDRNRQSEKDGFVYLANELKGYMRQPKRGGYAS